MTLTAKQKKAICAKYSAGGVSQKTLAIEYGVSRGTIYKVLNNDTDFVQKVAQSKKEAEESAFESIAVSLMLQDRRNNIWYCRAESGDIRGTIFSSMWSTIQL